MAYAVPAADAFDFSQVSGALYELDPESLSFPESGNVINFSGEGTLALDLEGTLKTPVRLQAAATGSLTAINYNVRDYWPDPENVWFKQYRWYVDPPTADAVDFPGAFSEKTENFFFGIDASLTLAGEATLTAASIINLEAEGTLSFSAEGDITVSWNAGAATGSLTAEPALLQVSYLKGEGKLGLKGFGLGMNPDLGLETGVPGFPVTIPTDEGRNRDSLRNGPFGLSRTPDHEPLEPWKLGTVKNPTSASPWNDSRHSDHSPRLPWEDTNRHVVKCMDLPRGDPDNPILSKEVEYYLAWDSSIQPLDWNWWQSYIFFQLIDISPHLTSQWHLVDEYGSSTIDKSAWDNPYVPPEAWQGNFNGEGVEGIFKLQPVDFRAYRMAPVAPVIHRMKPQDMNNFLFDFDNWGDRIDSGCGIDIGWDQTPGTDSPTIEFPTISDPTDENPNPEDPDFTKKVPFLWRYLVVNDIIVRRLSDGQEINITGFTIDIDPYLKEDGIQLALISEADFDLVAPVLDPINIEIIINGERRVFALNAASTTCKFLGSTYTVSGKSLTTYLGEPYIRPYSVIFDQTLDVAQLVDKILENTGWTVTIGGYWEEDIEAFTYTMDQKTPIEAIFHIAKTLGYSLRPHPENQHIDLELFYPVVPSGLGSALKNYVIPTASLLQMTQQIDRGLQATGVWVGGSNVGVFDQIVKQGSDGSNQLPVFTDDLIQTHLLAQQKGIELLSYSQRRRKVNIVMPVYPESDIILPNKTIKITDTDRDDFSAYTRKVQITAKCGKGGTELLQTVTLERPD